MTGHVAGHVTGQTWFGHVTFPWSRASEVPESWFVTLEEMERKMLNCLDVVPLEQIQRCVVIHLLFHSQT